MAITRRRLLATSAAGAAVIAGASAATIWRKAPKKPPNIVLFIADDMRADALGAAGNRIVQTPCLDALAAQGIYSRNHFVTTSICPTSRASIFTGMYAFRHGVHDFPIGLRPEHHAAMFPYAMRRAGYYTGFVGKWGFGGPFPTDAFDSWQGFGGQGDYIQAGGVHLTDIQADQALGFLNNRDRAKPFFLALSFKAPHGPYIPQEGLRTLYEGVQFPRARTDTVEYANLLPALLKDTWGRNLYFQWTANDVLFQETCRNYYRLVTGMDRAMKRVLEFIIGQGADDDTCILFTSDNGLLLGDHGLAGKWCMYEDSIRVPLILRLPASMREGSGRQAFDGMTLNIDIAPTLLALAGLPKHPAMQGENILDMISGHTSPRRDFYYQYDYPLLPGVTPCEGVRGMQYKYTRYYRGAVSEEVLFDLVHDPYEARNLAVNPAHRAQLVQLRQRMQEWRRMLG